ncbi:Protein FAR1-RELATED SEQUENCE 11 [Senna tora]|uniref:Protein FAR1-RELATED SEQUENCE 11 n=1 Tax=Senna tora TaxID=362788 RepID=A0A835CHH0_9FABA|nr:Protein FAR1-RELATED SEQUENCE 11 [Senna tora]
MERKLIRRSGLEETRQQSRNSLLICGHGDSLKQLLHNLDLTYRLEWVGKRKVPNYQEKNQMVFLRGNDSKDLLMKGSDECIVVVCGRLQWAPLIIPEMGRSIMEQVISNVDRSKDQHVRFLPTHRIISAEDCELILFLKEGGLSVRQITRVLELEKNVKHGYLSFLEKDIHYLFIKVRNKDAENDAMALLKHCEDAKKDDTKFKYSYTMENEGKLQHIFLSSPCFDWYTKYGDVVVFDTTYKVNAYEMPFGVFVGINNHGKTIIFGCALLRNETTATFSWLMKVDLAIEDIQRKEEHDTMLVKYRGSSLKPISPLQEQAHGVLTEFAFEKFQEEFKRSIQYSIVQESEFIDRYVEFTKLKGDFS